MRTYLLIFLVGLSTFAHSQSSHPALSSSSYLRVGAFYQDTFAGMRGYTTEQSGSVSLESLGIDEEEIVPQLAYYHRFGEHWQINVFYSNFKKSGARRLEEVLNIYDEVFEVGLDIETEFSLETLAVTASYDVYRDRNSAFQVGLGIHALEFGTGIEADITSETTGEVTEIKRSSDDLLAPLPNISASYKYTTGNDWLLRLNAGWFSASVDNYSGELFIADAALEYQLTANVGAGFGYQYNNIDVVRDGKNGLTEYDVKYSGPNAFLVWYF